MELPEFFTATRQPKGCFITLRDLVLAKRSDQGGIDKGRVKVGIVRNEDPLGKTGASMALLQSDLRQATNAEVMAAIEVKTDDAHSALPSREVAAEQRRQVIAVYGGV